MVKEIIFETLVLFVKEMKEYDSITRLLAKIWISIQFSFFYNKYIQVKYLDKV